MKIHADQNGRILAWGTEVRGEDFAGELPADFDATAASGKYRFAEGQVQSVEGWEPTILERAEQEKAVLNSRIETLRATVTEEKSARASVEEELTALREPANEEAPSRAEKAAELDPPQAAIETVGNAPGVN